LRHHAHLAGESAARRTRDRANGDDSPSACPDARAEQARYAARSCACTGRSCAGAQACAHADAAPRSRTYAGTGSGSAG